MQNPKENSVQNCQLARLSCWLLFIIVMAKWILTETIFSFAILKYLAFIVPFFLFTMMLVKYGHKLILDSSVKIWIPWLLFILLQTMLSSNWERFAYHFTCLALLLLAVNIDIIHSFPQKLALFIGIFSILGIGVEYFFPSFHNAVINPIFIGDSFDDYGLRGFTYQVGASADYILLFEMIWLYVFKDKVRPIAFWTFLLISLLAISLTGKRMHTALCIVIPILVYILSQTKKNHAIFLLIVAGIIGFIAIRMFISNAENFTDNAFLHRFSSSVEVSQGGDDITSNRSVLAALAIAYWMGSPILGIGDMNFAELSGADMGVHNSYLQTLCEQGIIGFVLWFIPLVYCFIITCRIFKRVDLQEDIKQWLKLSLFCQLQFILYGLTGNPTINESSYVLYFFAIAILAEIHIHSYGQSVETTNSEDIAPIEKHANPKDTHTI